MNRKVILYIGMSLDGYIADEQGGIEWLEPQEAPTEGDTHYQDFYETVDTVILGRTTYDQIVNELSPGQYPYADATSYIMTSRLETSKDKLHFTNERVVDLVMKLKEEAGDTIWIVGGSSVVMPLVQENLIDEYQLAIVPTILGKGVSLFHNFEPSLLLKLTSVESKNGLIYTRFLKA